MKFTPLAGIETRQAIEYRVILIMKFTPLAGIETMIAYVLTSAVTNEIHTPSGDWNMC